MADVAAAAGVHPTTVSLALRGHPSIPETTRVRVRQIADRLGYRPHPLVSALMTFRRSSRDASRHTTLAYVTSSQPAGAWRQSQTLREQFAGAKERARSQGYHVEEFPLFASGLTPARVNQVLRTRGILGLIIAPLRNGANTLPLEWEHFAAVGVAFTLQEPNIPRVGSDHGQSVRLAIQECRRRGYRRIGLAVQRTLIERVEEQWLAGYLVEHAHPAALRHPPPLIVDRLEEETFRVWFHRERPDVVLTGGDPGSVLAWLRKARCRVPADAGVVSLDLHERDGSIAGIDQHSHELGAAVVDHLIARLHRNERGVLPRPLRIHSMGEWVDGLSIRPIST